MSVKVESMQDRFKESYLQTIKNEASRGQHRRRRDTPEDSQPLFLKKCFHMITDCDPEIATWSDAGDSFIVKDVTKFSAEVIPTIYKHNKFSSFVRQLNFCKFSLNFRFLCIYSYIFVLLYESHIRVYTRCSILILLCKYHILSI